MTKFSRDGTAGYNVIEVSAERLRWFGHVARNDGVSRNGPTTSESNAELTAERKATQRHDLLVCDVARAHQFLSK